MLSLLLALRFQISTRKLKFPRSLRIYANVVSCSSIPINCHLNAVFCSVNPKKDGYRAYEVVRDNSEALDSLIIYNCDFSYN